MKFKQLGYTFSMIILANFSQVAKGQVIRATFSFNLWRIGQLDGGGGSSRAFAIYFPVPLLDCCNKGVAFTIQIMLIKPYLDLYSELPHWSKKSFSIFKK